MIRLELRFSLASSLPIKHVRLCFEHPSSFEVARIQGPAKKSGPASASPKHHCPSARCLCMIFLRRAGRSLGMRDIIPGSRLLRNSSSSASLTGHARQRERQSELLPRANHEYSWLSVHLCSISRAGNLSSWSPIRGPLRICTSLQNCYERCRLRLSATG